MRTLARLLAWLLLLLAAVSLAVYAVGRAFTDHFNWSQFVFWLPAWLPLGFAVFSLACGWGLSLILRRGELAAANSTSTAPPPTRRPSRPLIRRACLALACCTGLCIAHAALQARLYRVFLPRPAVPDAELRFLHWNAMSPQVVPRDSTLPPLLARHEPDLVLLSMALAPHQYDGVVSQLPPGYTSIHSGIFAVVSRLPILEHRRYHLGLADGALPLPARAAADPRNAGPVPDEPRHLIEYLYNTWGPSLGLPHRYFRNADPGTLLLLTLDGGDRFSRPIAIAYIDLPSDPIRSKSELAAAVATRLQAIATERGEAKFAPDFIIGDFNIPRGSDSLATIAPGMTSAFDDAGIGPMATWPRRFPVLHLDQCFRSAAWRVHAYEADDSGSGDHMMQVISAGRAEP